MAKTLLQERNLLVQRIVQAEVNNFLQSLLDGADHTRECLTCDEPFEPVHRYHFFCKSDCRTIWYSGQIRPYRPRKRALQNKWNKFGKVVPIKRGSRVA